MSPHLIYTDCNKEVEGTRHSTDDVVSEGAQKAIQLLNGNGLEGLMIFKEVEDELGPVCSTDSIAKHLASHPEDKPLFSGVLA